MYGYIQKVKILSKEFWGVGFLSDYNMKRLFFNYWGIQSAILVFVMMKEALSKRFKAIFSLNIIKSEETASGYLT